MSLPTANDWSFEEIRQCDPHRAERLETPKSAQSHIAAVNVALREALRHNRSRLARENSEKVHADRAVIQFLLPPTVYDQFFNARSGYRAHFWDSPASGLCD